MLQSESRQAQSLAAFHFAMEASVKNDQKNLKVLHTLYLQRMKNAADFVRC